MDTNTLINEIREQVVQICINRYIFRVHQEIIRRNPALLDRPRHVFGDWARTVYVAAATSAIRRLSSGSGEDGDVSLVRLIDDLIRNPGHLWPYLVREYPNETAAVHAEMIAKNGSLPEGWELGASTKVLGIQRALVIRTSDDVNRFASKRIAHHVPAVAVSTTFDQLDSAIDTATKITEVCNRVYCLALLGQLPTGDSRAHLLQLEAARNLDSEAKRRLPAGWERVFLIPWATEEIISHPLGDLKPPRSDGRS
jgi:hypothetical protein